MIRRQRFTRFETVLLWLFAALLVAAAATGLLLSFAHARWSLALASLGTLGIAFIYLLAARRGKPL